MVLSACKSQEAGTPAAFRALGEEPFWSLDIAEDNIVFEELGRPEAMIFEHSAPQLHNGAYLYEVSSTEPHGLKMRISLKPQRCYDSMAGTPFEYTATVSLSGMEYRGCAAQKKSPEQVIADFIDYCNSKDGDGVRSLLMPETEVAAAVLFSASAFKIVAQEEITGIAAGDLQLEVRLTTIDGNGDVLVRYRLHNLNGLWRIYEIKKRAM